MTDNYFYFAVRIIVCGYLFNRMWVAVFRKKLYGLWGKILIIPKPGKGAREPAILAVSGEDMQDVVGKTKVVYLEDPEMAATVPAHSEKLEPADFIGEEPDISDGEIESDLSVAQKTPEEILDEQERFEVMDDLAPGLDPDFSIGLSYDEMANAVDVLTVVANDENQIIEAARTIFRIKETDLFEFFTHQVSNLYNVESLMNDCLDNDGVPLPVRRSKRNEDTLDKFDLNKFV